MSEILQRRTSLSGNILAFCRHLRTQGFRLGTQQEVEALHALTIMGRTATEENFYWTLRATLTRSRQEQQQFDDLYRNYWREINKAADSKIKEEETVKNQPAPKPSLQTLKSWLYGGRETEEEMEIATYSEMESLTQKDFSQFTTDELEEVMKIIRLLAKRMATQYNRRQRTAHRPGSFNLRQTLRKNMRRGGEIIELSYVRPKRQKLKIVLLCDVSKSMDLYTNFLLQFMYGFQQLPQRMETFVFATQLTRVTEQLRRQAFPKALKNLQDTIPDWSGGTKIGASLQTFVENHGLRLLDRKTIFLIMSDGWDTGEVDVLAEAMAYIKRKSGRVIWLNPLAGNPNFTPEVQGMAAAMPYVDVFAPAHNVHSLRQVVALIK
ncbi:MAG: VWA domain-containing protein [Saprospiraceae bacterium]